MGWLWGPSNDAKSSSPSGGDPLRHLDPSLRDFLKKESPVKYSDSNPPAPKQPTPTPQIQAQVSQPQSTASDTKPSVPSQSLYQDGRYAHLWATYQPQAVFEAEAKSDADKINDVIEGYKHRKAEIGRAALENCSLEQWEVNECFKNGGVTARMTMCRAENRKFERCYLMQARFLKALGYLSTLDRPAEVDEKIQMHADTLYHRMLDQEAAIEVAKAEGRPIPTFAPLMSTSTTSTTEAIAQRANELAGAKEAELSPEVRKQLQEAKNLSEGEKELTQRAIAAEIKAGEEVATNLGNIFKKQDEERRKRKESGKETLVDYLGSLFGSK